MFNPNTPFHMTHSSMTCMCAQCREEKNAVTARLPRFDAPKRKEKKLLGWQVSTGWDAETGEHCIIRIPIYFS